MSLGLSARQAAKVLGLTHSALLKAAKTGRITREPDKSFVVDRVRRQLAENSNAHQRRKPISLVTGLHEVGTGIHTLSEAQRQREWMRVQKEELELKRIKGELAPIGKVNAFVAGMVIRAREILTAMPSQLKDRLAQESRPAECEQLLTAEVRRALDGLSEFRNQKRIL
jgi:hypothetical protein